MHILFNYINENRAFLLLNSTKNKSLLLINHHFNNIFNSIFASSKNNSYLCNVLNDLFYTRQY